MKMIICLLLVGFLVNCSDGPVDFETGEVEGVVIGKKLKVANKLDRSIFYFAVEQETATLIDWIALSREENEIKALDAKDILLDDILGYKKGKNILFYYWMDKDGQVENMKNLVIATD